MLNAFKCRRRPAHFLVALVSVGVLITGACAQNDPDPLALLQGVESARLQIPPSSLTLRYIYRDPLVTNETLMVAEFDGELRRFESQGNGTTNSYWSTVFDGSKAITYEERLQNVEYRSLATPNDLSLFDPRLLGLTHANAWDEALAKILPLKATDGKFELVGRQEINGRLAWHVRFQSVGGRPIDQLDYWIDDLHGFRVYRKDWAGIQTFSYYENDNYPWLPSRVVSKAPEYEQEVQVIQAKADVRFPQSRWGLAGMKLKPQTVVLNHDPPRIVGVWDGSRMVPEFEGAPRPPLWSYIIMILVLALPAVFVWGLKRMRERRRPM